MYNIHINSYGGVGLKLHNWIERERKLFDPPLGKEMFVEKMAKDLGIAKSTLYNWLNGNRKPSARNMVKLVEYTRRKVRASDLRSEFK